MLFSDRADAGRKLGQRLLALKDRRPVVLALPRGGVPVAFEVAKALHAPLDLVLVRKLGAPYQEEFALGAVADGETPEFVANSSYSDSRTFLSGYLEEARADALQEIERRRHAYLAGREHVEVTGRTAIVVDDGIATGSTMLAALRATRRRHPARLVLAVPVAPADALQRLAPEADEVICLHAPVDFSSVGQFYRDFEQTRDEDVIALLAKANDGDSVRRPRT